jgi:Heterokaryon incompatibility protein (HET)
MLEISHYGSLDERLEAGPPIDALCQKCRSLKVSELFSGPRYEDLDDGYEHPILDVFIGTVAESRRSANECRFCYLISAFHDAKHVGSNAPKGGCKGDSERCILKPYRTDAALRMKDQSNDSDKESFATSLILVFQDPTYLLKGKRVEAVFTRDVSNAGRQNGLISRTKSIFSRKSQQNDLAAESKSTNKKTKDGMDNPRQTEHPSCNSVSPTDGDDRDTGTSAKGMHEMEFRPTELPNSAYQYHNCLFCLTDTSYLGRRRALSFSTTARGPRIDWPSLRSWLETCEQDHPACHVKHVDPTAEAEIRIRCIDVKSSAIVQIGPNTRYLALSYVWGTAHSKLAEHISRCIIGNNSTVMTESLPSTIRDAIRVTERLGEQYLWVDSLCLDQSDPSTIATEIGFMDRIYENAVLTLITSASQDVYSEIPGLRTHSRLRSISEVYIGERPIKAVCATVVDSEFRGLWSHRAWTFQEWILSKRCLFFSHDQIMFRCQELSGLESFRPPKSTSPAAHAVIPKFWADSQCDATILPRLSLDAPIWNFQTYADLACEYTSRQLSYASDVIRAFTGITRKLERSNGMAFVDAMPAGDLLRSLLWTSSAPGAQKWRRTYLPSWTWAAWGSHAQYLCWELDESSGGETFSTQRYTRLVGLRASHVKRADALPFQLARKANSPVVLSIGKGYEIVHNQRLYRGFRLRSAEVALLPKTNNVAKTCLRISSETRSVLIHQNPPNRLVGENIGHSKDDLLHPVTKEVIAGQNFADNDRDSRQLLAFSLAVGVSSDESFSSHVAILMYEWEIGRDQGKYHRKVVAMVIDRLYDGTVERVALVSIRSKDWRTLPLVNEREELTMV